MKNTIQNILIATTIIFTLAFASQAQTAKRETKVSGSKMQAFQSLNGRFAASRSVANGWEVEELVRTASRYIDAYWRDVFSYNGLRYNPPVVLRSASRIQNAYFAPSSNTIVYDYVFFNQQLTKHGDFAVVTILAHEWGHAVQHMLRTAFIGDIERELQADCYAGSFARNESRTPRLESNDVPKAISALIEAGDSPATNIFARNAHGSADKRRKAFYRGLSNGLNGCKNLTVFAILGK